MNAFDDDEVLADFVRDLCNLAADIICVNPGSLHLRALLRVTTGAFWSCVQPSTSNIAFLLKTDMEFAKHSRLRRRGPVHVPEIAGSVSHGTLFTAARTVPYSTMPLTDSNMSQASRGRKHRRGRPQDLPSVTTKRPCIETSHTVGHALVVPAKPTVPPPPPPPLPAFWPVGGVDPRFYPEHPLPQDHALQPGPSGCWRSPGQACAAWPAHVGPCTWYVR